MAPKDSEAVRSRVDATQVNTYGPEDGVQATLPIKASMILSNAKEKNYSSSVGWKNMKAWYGKHETNKCTSVWEVRPRTS